MIKYLASIILIRHIIFIDDEDLSGNNEVSWPENCISQSVFSSRVPLFVTISDQVLIFDDVFNSVNRGHLSIGAVWLQVSPRNAIERFQYSKDWLIGYFKSSFITTKERWDHYRQVTGLEIPPETLLPRPRTPVKSLFVTIADSLSQEPLVSLLLSLQWLPLVLFW